MSASADLQKVIYQRLVADPAIHALVEDRIYDGAPSDVVYPCITFGPSDVLPRDYDCITGREEVLQIDCWTRDQGRMWPCRRLADAVRTSLDGYEADMGTHALVGLTVRSWRVLPEPDGISAHGIVSVQALVEER